MHYEYLKAAAEGAAKVSDLQSWCYHYANDRSDITRQALTEYYANTLKTKGCKPKYIAGIICAALSDFEYPTHDVTKYALSGNQRLSIAGIAKRTWSRNQLCNYVNFIIDDIRSNAAAVRAAIDAQLAVG